MKSKDFVKNITLKCLAEILEAEKHLQHSRRSENLKNLFKSKKLHKATSSKRIEEPLRTIKKVTMNLSNIRDKNLNPTEEIEQKTINNENL